MDNHNVVDPLNRICVTVLIICSGLSFSHMCRATAINVTHNRETMQALLGIAGKWNTGPISMHKTAH